MRLLLDEMYPQSIAQQLRTRGFDVVSIHEPPFRALEGMPDADVLAAAATDERVLVTENVADFQLLLAAAASRGEPRPGLNYTTNDRFPRGRPETTGALVRALAQLLTDPGDQPPVVFLRLLTVDDVLLEDRGE